MPATSELLQKGRYRFDSSTPEAGASHAVQAYDTTSDTKVYVKEIAVRLGKVTTLSQQENTRQNFENAARKLSELQHESLLKVKDFYSEVGRQYLVLEEPDGDDFYTLLNKNKRPFAVEDVLDWADQLLDAINYLHNQSPRMLHKSISPRNVKLSANGKVKLLGLGITDESGNLLTTSLGEPEEGILNYSPLELIWDGLDAASQKVIVNSYDERSEKILKEAPDVRSDIYSLAATLYLLLTAKTPVDPLERSIELLEGNADPLKAPKLIDTRVAPEISDVLMRALEIRRENRYDSATIMRQVLRTAVVRVKEREAAEAQELEEAAEFLRGTQKLQIPEPQPSQPSEKEILTQKLREAEQLRIEAERRAAEAERLLREREAEQVGAEDPKGADKPQAVDGQSPVPDADIQLDSMSESGAAIHISEPEGGVVPSDTDEDIHISAKPEPRAKIDLRSIAKAPVEPGIEQSVPAVVGELNPGAESTENEAFTEARPNSEPFSDEKTELSAASQLTGSESNYPAEVPVPEFATSRSGLPMPLVAGAAALILIAAVVGYVFLGGSGSGTNAGQPAKPTENAVVPSNQPEPPAPTTAAETITIQQPENSLTQESVNTESEAAVAVAEPESAPKSVQAPKVTKPAVQSAKTPTPKKAVTADDLINDN